MIKLRRDCEPFLTIPVRGDYAQQKTTLLCCGVAFCCFVSVLFYPIKSLFIRIRNKLYSSV